MAMTGEIESKPKDSIKNKAERAIRRNIYRFHRILGLLAIVPTIFWTASGVMHPFMSHWFKTSIAKEFYQPEQVVTEDVQLALGDVLRQHRIAEFKNFRLVKFEGNSYYQIKDTDDNLRYFNTITGNELKEGDKKYAQHIARLMLGDQKSPITSSTRLTTFTDQYKYVNRYLPVWKIRYIC
jgi:hypothetical protein